MYSLYLELFSVFAKLFGQSSLDQSNFEKIYFNNYL